MWACPLFGDTTGTKTETLLYVKNLSENMLNQYGRLNKCWEYHTYVLQPVAFLARAFLVLDHKINKSNKICMLLCICNFAETSPDANKLYRHGLNNQ